MKLYIGRISIGRIHLLPIFGLIVFLIIVEVRWGVFGKTLKHESTDQITQRVAKKMEKDLSSQGLSPGNPIFIRIFKESNELELWLRPQGAPTFKLFKTYPILKYSGSLGPKLKEGDLQAPEGFYHVSADHLNPNSRYHLAFNIGYPNEFDRAHARTGSAIMVHGSNVSIGCFAMGDPAIEEIYTLAESALKNGQSAFPVHIFPFRLTPDALARHSASPWHPFWQNLKEGYDRFEAVKLPPTVTVANQKYIFAATQ